MNISQGREDQKLGGIFVLFLNFLPTSFLLELMIHRGFLSYVYKNTSLWETDFFPFKKYVFSGKSGREPDPKISIIPVLRQGDYKVIIINIWKKWGSNKWIPKLFPYTYDRT